MMRSILSSTILLALVLLPLGVQAQYLTPEDVLLRDQNALLVPTNRRQAQEAADAQAAQRAEQHTSTITEPSDETPPPAAPAAGEEPVPTEEEPSLHPSAPEEPADYASELDPITLRLLRRLQEQESQALPSTALHSGAPLADTGPAEIMTVMVLIAAIGWTVLRSKGMRGVTK